MGLGIPTTPQNTERAESGQKVVLVIDLRLRGPSATHHIMPYRVSDATTPIRRGRNPHRLAQTWGKKHISPMWAKGVYAVAGAVK